MKNLSPVAFDGIMYASIALFSFLNAAFGSDESKQYVSPQLLFWLKIVFGALGATALAVKMYRSTTFAEYKQAQNGSYHAPDLAPSEKPQPQIPPPLIPK